MSRGVRSHADDVVITNGIQQALDLIVRVLLEPGGTIAMEDPGYRIAQLLFTSLGARVVPVRIDADGIVVDELPDDARLVYVTPSHQLPLGMPMSLNRRLALLDWAEEHGAAIVEDDYDSEFRFGGRPMEPLQSLDRRGRVLYLGSFSKVMLPSLRLGFMVTPPPLHDALRKAKFVSDWSSPLHTQAALARFIDEGLLARHLRKMRAVYQARHACISAALAKDFSSWLAPISSTTGLHLTAMARNDDNDDDSTLGVDDVYAICRSVHPQGVTIRPIADFSVGAAQPGMIFGYGAIPTERIPDGLAIVHTAFAALSPGVER